MVVSNWPSVWNATPKATAQQMAVADETANQAQVLLNAQSWCPQVFAVPGFHSSCGRALQHTLCQLCALHSEVGDLNTASDVHHRYTSSSLCSPILASPDISQAAMLVIACVICRIPQTEHLLHAYRFLATSFGLFMHLVTHSQHLNPHLNPHHSPMLIPTPSTNPQPHAHAHALNTTIMT